MTNAKWCWLCAGLLCVTIATRTTSAGRDQATTKPPATASTQTAAPAAQKVTAPAASNPGALVGEYCTACHNERSKRGNLSLTDFDLAKVADNAEVGEKMIRKLEAGMMPPPGSRRPEQAAIDALIHTLETKLDAAYLAHPNPGIRTFQRLNRPEYAQAVKDLLALEIDPGAWLPNDQKSANFDNIADEQTLSATLLESFLNAAGEISRMAIGDRSAPLLDRTYTNTSYVSQHPWDHVEGAPYGTRGGMVVNHVFPADAEYVFELTFTGGDNSRLEDIDLSIDGQRALLVRYETGAAGAADGRGAVPVKTEPILVKAGQHKVAAAFVRRFDGPYEDLIRPHDWSFAGGGSGGSGITTLPHLRDLIVRGPFKVTGISDTPSRRRIFTCRPTGASEERPCAQQIIAHLASSAYRRSVPGPEVNGLMQFYDIGAAKGGFESGVRTALEAILASPYFYFRLEKQPAGVKPGTVYRISDLALASRLSFFLWGTPPDKTLLDLASKNLLGVPATLEQQARRMLADPRAAALGPRFAGQWLRLQDIDKVHPDPNFYPNFGEQLAGAMKRETETFFNDLVKRDRSVLELYRADYTFINEQLARHYGIAGVAGEEFRRVTYPDATRRGIFGQGSMLVQTSYAGRTSPVLRGKWVMEVLMGTPPPPPPQDGSVPPLEKTAEANNGKMLTTRERVEMHRANPTCNSCHRFIDPIGLALDKFDVTAKWRERENGAPLDTRGQYYDGTDISTPAELSAVLLKRPVPLVRTFTENLMAYAYGRRVEYFDQPVVRAISDRAQVNGYKMSDFILGVIMSEPFRNKRADAIDPVSATKTTKTSGGR
jgi:hypothetical protein